MIVLPRARDQLRVRRAIREAQQARPLDLRDTSYEVRLSLRASLDDSDPGVEFADRLNVAEWGQEEIPITLDATLGGHPSRTLEDARLRLVVEVEGVEIPQLWGEKSVFLSSSEPYSTDILVSTAGSLLAGEDAIKLGTFTEYHAMEPSRIVSDVIAKLPYQQSQVDIQTMPGVEITYAGSGETPGFLASEPAGGVLERLAEEQTVGYDYRDGAAGGFRAWVPQPLGSGDNDVEGESSSGFRFFDASLFPDWHANRPRPTGLRYSDVRVYHLDPDSAELLFEYVVDVPYREGTRPPHKGRTLDIPFEDASTASPQNARLRALEESEALARNPCLGDNLTLPAFDPLLERGDPFWVHEYHVDDDGSWDILWAMRTLSYKHILSQESTLDTVLSYEAVALKEEKIAVPNFIFPTSS